ncbi:MAG: hypothetical protein ACJ74Y_12775 [Bryobacteraceae bacterium]
MRVLPLSIGALLLASASLIANSGSAEDPGKQIVDEALKALGGDHFLNMHTRVSSGRLYSFFRDQISGAEIAHIYTEYPLTVEKGSLGVIERQVLGKKQDYSYLFLGSAGWDITYRGARQVEEETWNRYRRTTENDILYILKLRKDEPGWIYDFVGSQVFLSRHVDIVELNDSQNRTVRVYFDHNTRLPLHQEFSWLDPVTKSRNDEITDYDKYRDIGAGIMWPYTIQRSRNGYKAFQMFADSVQANGTVPPKTLELPAGTKIPR